jgi:hypothetical protein
MPRKPHFEDRSIGRRVKPVPEIPGRKPPDGSLRAGPFPRNSFRVSIAEREIGLCAVSAPHWGDGRNSDPALRPTMTLRRAVGQDRTLYEWRRQIGSGKDDPRTVTVILLDGPGGDPVIAWDLANARAVRWSGPELDAFSSEPAFEELEITYEDIVWRDRP